MFITKSYRYMKNGIEYVSGTLPEDATLTEIMDILNAEEGFELVRNGERIGTSVWLKDGDSENNYSEVEVEQDI